jgi:hypothetical protein
MATHLYSTEQTWGTVRINKCDCIYMSVLSPLSGTSFASHKILKWDNLTVEQVTIIHAIYIQCLNTILSILIHWLVQAMLLCISVKNECDLKVWAGNEGWNIHLHASPLMYFTHHLCMLLWCASLCLCCSFNFLYLLLLFHSNTSYKWNSSFHTLSTT